MKVKEMKWVDFDNKFSGIARKNYERTDLLIEHKSDRVVKYYYREAIVYNPRKDCTYIACVCNGLLNFSIGVNSDRVCTVIRLDGKKGKKEVEELDTMILEEAFKHYRKEMNS